MTEKTELVHELEALKFHYLANNLDDICSRAEQSKTPYKDFIAHICRLEGVERSRRSTERRLYEAAIGKFKPLEQFDWRWPENLEKSKVDRILQLDFVKDVSEHGNPGAYFQAIPGLSRNFKKALIETTHFYE